MTLKDFLLRIKKLELPDTAELSIMTELKHEPSGLEIQVQHKVTDVTFSNRSGIVIIGQELD